MQNSNVAFQAFCDGNIGIEVVFFNLDDDTVYHVNFVNSSLQSNIDVLAGLLECYSDNEFVKF